MKERNIYRSAKLISQNHIPFENTKPNKIIPKNEEREKDREVEL